MSTPSVPGGREVFSRSAPTSRTLLVVQGPHARRCKPRSGDFCASSRKGGGAGPGPQPIGARPDKRVFPSEALPVPKEKGPAWPRRGARRFPPHGGRRTHLLRLRGGSPRARGGDRSAAECIVLLQLGNGNNFKQQNKYTFTFFTFTPAGGGSLLELGVSGHAGRSPSRERPTAFLAKRAHSIRAPVNVPSLRRRT